MSPVFNKKHDTDFFNPETNTMNMGNTLSMILQPTAFDSEQLKSLALNIVRENKNCCPGVIMVANSVSENDKGLVAVNLAVSMADNSDKNVLLIDCDVTSPAVHTFFQFTNKVGLIDFISEKKSLASVLQQTKIKKLRVLTCGNTNDGLNKIMPAGKVEKFIHELSEKCPELIIIINTDASQLTGGFQLSQDIADGIVLALDQKAEAFENTKNVLENISQNKLLGVIKKRLPKDPVIQITPEVKKQFEKTLRLVMAPEKKAVKIYEHPGVPTVKKEKPYNTARNVPAIRESLMSMVKPDSFGSEQFKMLITSMMDLYKNKKSQVFMVTSTSEGEGKSFVAANLARSFAISTNKKVLLIDCDLKSPSVHSHFGKENISGLSEYLSQDISFSSQCIDSGVENLALLTSGQLNDDSFRLLSSEKMVYLIKCLKKKFKDLVIILDSAPPALVAESNLISKLADGIAIVVSHNKSKCKEIKTLTEMFDKKKIIGVIYNRFKPERSLLKRYKNYCRNMLAG